MWEPEEDEDYENALTELNARYAEWVADHELDVEAEVPEVLLHYKWRYLDGHLTRWTRGDLSEIYLELYPAKVVAEPEDLDEILDRAATFFQFLSEVDLADDASDPLDTLLSHLEHVAPRFRAAMTDVSRYSMGKRFTMAALAEAVDLGDPGEVDAFMARFNARSRAERELLMGPSVRRVPASGSSGRVTAKGTPPRPSSTKRRKRRR